MAFPSSGCVAYWSLNGDSVERFGNNNGTDTSITYSSTSGLTNQYAIFDASGDKITCTSTNIPTGSSARSFSVWVKLTGAMLPFHYGTGGGSFGLMFGLYIDTASISMFGYGADLTVTTTNATGTWIHLVVTYDGTTTTIYKNGSSVGTGTPSLNTTTGSSFVIGHDNGTWAGGGSSGNICELGCWNRALSGSEVTSLYNSGAGLTFNSGVTGIAMDYASHAANNVTAVTSVTWAHTVTTGATALVVQSGLVTTGTTISGITFNGTSLTRAVQYYNSFNVQSEIWYLLSPTATTANIVVTYSVDANKALEPKNGAISLFNTDTSSLIGVTGTAGTSTGAVTKSVTTTVANSYLVDMITQSGTDLGSPTGSGQTQIWRDLNSAGGGTDGGGSYMATTSTGSYTMSWGGTTTGNWAYTVAEIKAPSASGAVSRRLALTGVGN